MCTTTKENLNFLTKSLKNLEVLSEDNFLKSVNTNGQRTQLNHSLTSLDDSFYNVERHFSISRVFTPDLRNEIFYSANRKLYSRKIQQSDSEIYKTVQNEEDEFKSPRNLSQKVFHDHLKERLHAIRAHEALLKQREENLNTFELKLIEKERHLIELQRKLDKKEESLDQKIKNLKQNNRKRSVNTQRASKRRLSVATKLDHKVHDETYCSIDVQDEMSPTVAKLNLKALPATKSLSNLRKVTFQSPKRIIKYEIENIPPKSQKNATNKFRNTVNSSSDSSSSTTDGANRRKSLLSLLGIKRNTKVVIANEKPELTAEQSVESKDILLNCEPQTLSNIWTKENKRAAFSLLAAMNATGFPNENSSKWVSRTGIRQSMRAPTHNLLRHERMRQSLKEFPLVI